MEQIEKKRISPKRIVFNISEEDHETIKKIAAKNRMPMRVWIINAMAKVIKMEELNEEANI